MLDWGRVNGLIFEWEPHIDVDAAAWGMRSRSNSIINVQLDKTHVKSIPRRSATDPLRPCGRAGDSAFHNGQATLSTHNFDVQSGQRWKVLELKER